MKHEILLVDAERRSVRVVGGALRNAGYAVRVAGNGVEALEKVEAAPPDIVLSDAHLPKLDGWGLASKLRQRPETARVPVVLLTSQLSPEDESRGREIGVVDYLAKPVFVRELLACVSLLVARGARQRIAAGAAAPSPKRLSGSTKDLSVLDLLQTFEVLRGTGVAHVRRGELEAELYFREGRAIDAKLGTLRGEEAVYATLVWNEASFDVEFKPVSREDVIDRSTGTLVVEGMRRVDEWGRIYEQLRSLTTIVEVDHARLLEQVISRLSDGRALGGAEGDRRGHDHRIPSVIADSVHAPRGPSADDGEEKDEDEGEPDEATPAETTPRASAPAHPEGFVAAPPVAAVIAPAAVVVAPAAVVAVAPAVVAVAPAVVAVPPAVVAAPVVVSAAVPAPALAIEPPRANATAARHVQPEPFALVSPDPTTLPVQATVTARMAHGRPAATIAVPGPVESRDEPAESVRSVTAGNPTSIGAPETAASAGEEPVALVREPRIPRAPAVPVADASPAGTSSPSSPPWTREVDPLEEPLPEHEMAIPGVGRTVSRTTKMVVAASVALATLICVVGGLRAVSARQQRLAEDARRQESPTSMAAPSRVDAIPPPANVDRAAEVAAAGPVGSTGEAPPHDAPLGVAPPTLETATGGPAATPAGRESPIAIPLRASGQSALVVAAEEALVRGATDRALVLANQAVAAAPADADTWLTLGAAHRAAGNEAAAREDYRQCVAQAVTEGKNHCRVLAER